MLFLPDPERSRALLVGTARYEDPELPDLPAVANNVEDLFDLLTDGDAGILPPSHCLTLADPDSVPAIGETLHAVVEEASDTLLVYYAGHGLIGTGGGHELYLSVTGSRLSTARFSALPIEVLKSTMRESPARQQVLILDCCFSGRAIGVMAASDDVVLGQMMEPGIYLLTSSPANRPSTAPEGARHTAFTGALIDVLRRGRVQGQDPTLVTLDGVYRQVASAARSGRFPPPRQAIMGSAGHMLLARIPGLQVTRRQPAADVQLGAPTARTGKQEAGEVGRWSADQLAPLTSSTLARLSEVHYPVTVTTIDPDQLPALVEERLRRYDRDIASLAQLIASVVLDGGQETDRLWRRSLARLLGQATTDPADAVPELVQARAYPALLISYVAGTAARLAGREGLVAAMLGEPNPAAGGRALDVLVPYRVVAPAIVAEFPTWRDQPPAFGLSIRLRRSMRPVFGDGFSDREYARAFEDYEYLRSLLELDLLDFTGWGEFAVALGRGLTDVDRRVEPLLSAGSPLLTAGAFAGKEVRAGTVARRLGTSARARYG